MEKTKNKGRKVVLLVCGILLALAVIAGGAAAVLFMNNGSSSEQMEYSGEVQVQDEQALRAALKSESDCEIVLSEDIVVSKELVVNGDKKLSGGSIIMNMKREGAGESVLSIQKGAKLVLDGTTVDGNSVANCISIKAGGELDSQSGSLVYGYPYGLDVSGKVTITDILIDEALHTAINVAIFGEVDMLGGTISNNVYGIAVAEEARMDIADGVTMTKSVASFIVNYGDMDIKGGKYVGSYDNAIENWGTMSVMGTKENPVKIADGKKSGINTKNRAKLKAEYVEFENLNWHAMCVEKNGKAELKNIYVNKTGKSSLYFNSATVELENATVVGGESYAIYATQNADVTMTDITVKEMKNRAITNERSSVTIKGLTLENVDKNGIYSTGKEAVTRIDDSFISATGTSGIGVASGEVFITNTSIESTKKEGLSVAKDGKATIEDSTIKSNGNFAIGNYGGNVTAKNVQISNTTNVSVKLMNACTFNGSGLTITNAGKQAISVEGGSSATVTNTKIDTTKMAAVYTDNATINLKNSTIKNAGSYAIAGKNNGKAVVDQIKIYNSGDHSIASFGSYIVATNVMITDPKRCGVYSEGSDARINLNQIEVYNTGSCGFGFKGAKEITARNVTIDSPKNEGIYAFKGANVKQLDNITIKNPGSHGISVEGEAIVNVTVDTNFNPDNKKDNGVTILNPGKVGIRCSNGTVTAKGVTIENAGAQGISANKESSVIVNGCTIDTTVQGGVYAEDSSLSLKNATITGAGTYGVAAKNSGKTLLDNVEVNNSGEHAIGSLNGNIVATNIKVNDPKRCGVYSEGEEAVINMNQVEVKNAGSCAFGFRGAKEITARNVLIENPKNEGIYAFNGANVKQLDNITINKPGSYGINVEGKAVVNVTVDTKFNPDNTKGNGVTVTDPGKVGIRCSTATVTAKGVIIKNAGAQGISANKESSVIVNGCTIDTTVQGGVYAEDSTLSLKNATVTNAGTYGVAAKNSGKTLLDNVEVNNSVEHAIGSLNGYIVATNIKVNDPKRCGVYSEGEEAVINMNQVEVTNAGSCGFGFNGAKEITARNVLIVNPKNEGIYAFNGANVKKLDDITINKPGSFGISVEGNATVHVVVDASFNPDNTTGNGVTIVNAGTHGIRVKGATLTAAGATVTDAKLHGVYGEADAKITLKKSAIASPGRHGIAILASATANVSETTITNAGERGLYNEGELTLTAAEAGQIALAIDTTADHGVYLGANANVVGSGLTIKNAGNNGIFSEGADMNISNFNLEKITGQGVQLKNGTVTLSNINVKEVGQATIYARNNTNLTLENGIIQAYSYGLATTDNAEVTVKNVTIEKSAKGEAYSANALINAEKKSKVDLQSGTRIDGKGKTGDGVNVVSSTTSVILNGATFANIADGNAAVYLKGSNTTIKLQKALTEAVSLKPNAYTNGLLVAEKATGISDADFEASMALLVPVNTDWIVSGAGRLSKPGDAVAAIGSTTYTSLEEAFAAANAASVQQTIVLLKDATVTGTIAVSNNVILNSNGAKTINGSVTAFKVEAGKTLTVAGTQTEKITFQSTAAAEVFYNEGTLNLTNVAVSGGKYAVNNRAGSSLNLTNVTIQGTTNNGLHLAGGTTTVTNVTISEAKGHGIGCYAELVLQPAAAGQTALTIDGASTTKQGLYVDWNGVVRGSGLDIKNTKNSGIFGNNSGSYTGINVNISDVQIENVGEQGVQVKRGSATISDFTIKGTGAAAVYPLNSAKLELSNGTIYANTFGLSMASSTEAVLTNVTLEKSGSNTDALVDISGNAKLELAGTTKIDGKNTGAAGVNVAASTATFTVNGGSVTGADVVLESGAIINVKSALASNIFVKPAAYAEGTVIAQKAGEISDTDFQASMAALIPADANWIVDGNGKLAKAACEHVWGEEITTQPTCSAEGVKTYTCSVCGSSYTEPVAKLPHTVTHVAYVAPSLEAAGNIEYWYCTVCNTAWEDAALTKVISLASVTLPKVEAGTVAYMNGESFQTLEAAVTKANETAASDTIYLLCDTTISAQLKATTDITIKAAKAVNVQVAEKVTGSVIYGTAGTLTITGASEDAKITIAASTKSQSMVKLAGGNAVLTNVHLKGNTSSSVSVTNGNCVQIEAGTLTAKNVTLTDCKGDGIRVYAGATANVDNVTISGAGKYGVNIIGTLNIYNTAHANQALSVTNTKDHGIRVEGTAQSDLNSVPADTYAIKAENNKGRGIVVIDGGSIDLSHVSVKNSGDCGVEFLGTGSGSLSSFAINGTGKAGLKKATGTVTLTNGSIITANCCVETSDGNLTATNVTVQRTSAGDALSINGATSHDGITVITE